MTTERRPPWLRMTPLELRSYLVALLAAVYTIAWRAIGGTTPVTESTAAVKPEPRTVWVDSPSRAVQAAPAQPVVRAPIQRAPRVRTRSS